MNDCTPSDSKQFRIRQAKALNPSKTDNAEIAGEMERGSPATACGSIHQITSRSAAALCKLWLEESFLIVANPSRKARRHHLAEEYDSLIHQSVK